MIGMTRKQSFTIPNRLASYGELVATCANNSEALKAREKHNVKLVNWAIGRADIAPIRRKCTLRIHWVEPTAGRRHAQVAAAAVFIESALVASGVVGDPMQIEAIYSTFRVDVEDPRIEVTIEDRF